MDVLRKELNAIYARQHLECEVLPKAEVERNVGLAEALTAVCRSCAVVTDAAKDRSYLFVGALGKMLGLPAAKGGCLKLSSSDEDMLYVRMHPEDLVDKRMLEYEFFKFVEQKPEAQRLAYKAVCHIRMKNALGTYVCVENSTQLLRLSPAGKIWLILCCYDLAPVQSVQGGIGACIVSSETGEVVPLSFSENRSRILSTREKEVLKCIREGLLSKEIAERLHISVNTVSRHRQNILQKLSVGNSIEAVNAADAMGLL